MVMTVRRIYKFWKSLSAQERKTFFQTRGKKLPSVMSTFFKAMHKNCNGDSSKLDAKIWKALFRNTAFNNTRFNSICNKALIVLAEHMKAVRVALELDGFLYPDLLLLREYAERDLDSLFSSLAKQLKKTTLEKTPQGKAYFDALFEIAWQEYDYYKAHVARSKKEFEIDELGHLNDLRYLYHLSRINAAILNRNQILFPPNPLHRPDLMFELAEELDLVPHPALSVLVKYLQVVSQGSDPKDIDEFTSFFIKNQNRLDNGDRFLMLGLLQNALVRKLNSGNPSYYRNLMSLYILGIRTGGQFAEGMIPPGNFKNFVVAALELKRYRLAEGFIEAYKDNIGREADAERTKLLVAFCKAMVHFEKGEFSEAKTILGLALSLPKFQDSFHNVGLRVLMIKVLFESEDWDQVQNSLHSLKMYIRNNKVLEKIALATVQTHITYLKKVFHLYADDAGDPAAIHRSLSEEIPFRGQDWILKKLEAKM